MGFANYKGSAGSSPEGAAKSVSEAARQLADEMGRKPETIKRAIERASGTATMSQLTGTAKHAHKPPNRQESVAMLQLSELSGTAKLVNLPV